MGIVRAYQKGTLKTPPSPEVQGVATSMKKSDVEKFASTKHKGLPEKVTEMADPLPKGGDKPLSKNVVKQKQKTQPSSSPYLPGKSPIPSEQIKEEESSPNNESDSRKNQPAKFTRIGDILNKMKNDPEKRLRQQMKEKDNENKDDVNEERKDTKGENHYSKKDPLKNPNNRPMKLDDLEKTVSSKPTAKEMLDSVRKKQEEIQNEDYVKELEDGLVKMDYPTYDEVDELMKKIAKDNGIDTTVLHMAFKTKHLMVPDDWAKKKMFEPVMIPKTPVKEGGWDDVESIVFKHRANQGRNPNPSFSDTVKNSKRNALKDLRDKLDKPVNNIVKKSKEDKEETKEEYLPEISKANPNKIKPENPYSVKNKLKMVGSSIMDRAKQRAKSLTRTYDEGILPDIILQRKIDLNGDEDKRILSVKEKKKKETQTEGNLRDWFKGSKSKDGKGGWVNVVTGGTCASDEPGEGTPKCVSSKKRASMTKAERLSAQRRKKAADPGQQSKKNAAKPTYVSTDSPKKKKKMSEGITYINPNNNRNDMGAPKGMKSTTPPKPKEKKLTKPPYENLAAEYAPKGEGLDERLGGKGVSKKAAAGSIYPGKKGDGDYPDSDRGAGNKAMRRSGGKVEAKSPTFLAYLKNKKNKMNEAKKVRRDEYGDIVGGPPISDKQRAKNLAKNEKDEKIVRSEAYSSRPSNVKKKAKLNAALKRLEDMKVASKMKKEEVEQINEFKKSPAWQRKAGKSESGGLNAKGVASYRAANPGSKLKTAVTTKPSKLKKGSKSAKRRLSFCRRMKGMKKKLTSAKTARDPDSRINKSLRKWNCSFEPEHGEVISEGKVAKMVKSLRRKTKVLEKGQKKERDAGAIAAKIMRDKEHNKYVSFLPAPTNEEKEIPANVKKIAKELDKAVAMHKSQAQRLRKAGISEGKKKCGEGEYYCNDMKKCRPIPKGYRVGYGGMLKPENEKDESNGKKGGSNGNGNGHGGNGNGHGGNGNGGNGGGGNGGGE